MKAAVLRWQIQCLIEPKKPVMDLGRGGMRSWIVFCFLGLREYADLILAKPRVA